LTLELHVLYVPSPVHTFVLLPEHVFPSPSASYAMQLLYPLEQLFPCPVPPAQVSVVVQKFDEDASHVFVSAV
jgi:hypothetical protein